MVYGSCGSTPKVLVGLHLVGVVGLGEALDRVLEAGLTDRKAVVDRLVELLAANNYIPDRRVDLYHQALWREYLRRKGEDIREFYSEIEVVVQGEPGEELDEFLGTLTSVLGDYELRPRVDLQPPAGEGRHPRLVIDGETAVEGNLPRESFKQRIKKRITEW